MSGVKAWAILRPSGEMMPDTIRKNKCDAWEDAAIEVERKSRSRRFVDSYDLERRGYRCVRVKVEQEGE